MTLSKDGHYNCRHNRCGTMGGALALLLAENGLNVSIYDTSKQSLERTLKNAAAAGLASRVNSFGDYESLCNSLGEQRLFMFSLPFGAPGIAVVNELLQHVRKGDIIIDASNENWKTTQARQELLRPLDVSYIGLGVSGGFSGARHGPSLMPGGDQSAVDQVLPILTQIAATDDQGRPCVTNIGSGGSGHFVKMIHNGIEHGIMSILCEAWGIMDTSLNMTGDQIGDVFDHWNKQGELKDNFLVSISGPICRTKHSKNGNYLLHQIKDAIVQDANETEGTGVWANLQSIESHVSAPSLAAAHHFRLASAGVDQRVAINASIGSLTPGLFEASLEQRSAWVEKLRRAVYISTLICFVQGLDIIERESQRQDWGIIIPSLLRIWRAGCIIKSDSLTSLFEAAYDGSDDIHPLCRPLISGEVRKHWPSLKDIVAESIKADAHVPCFSATLEFLKYAGNTNLPTAFTEAQMDAFGAHGYELKTEPSRGLLKGAYHDTWGLSM